MNRRELIQQGMVWIVGDGKDISFWFDNWIGKNSLCDLLELDRDVYPTQRVELATLYRTRIRIWVNYHSLLITKLSFIRLLVFRYPLQQ